MKFYIASPFFNEEQLRTVVGIEEVITSLRDNGHEVEYFSPRNIGVIKDMTVEQKKASMEDIYQSNVVNIRKCEGMICVVDWKDTGTLFELGYMSCLRESAVWELDHKDIITFSNTGKPVNVMLRYAIDAHANGLSALHEIIYHLSNTGKIPDALKNFPEVNE